MSTGCCVTVTRNVNATPAQALRGFTQATMLRDWLCNDASTSDHPGGHIMLSWREGYTTSGTYTRLDLPHVVEFTWLGHGDPGPSKVTVTSDEEGQGARVTLTHSWSGDGPAWEAQAARWNGEWTAALENLQSVLESGVDLRLARRPRLGIYFDEFNAEKAKKLGVPVVRGVLLEGTAEGSGARRAGLQKDDVLVSLNGTPLESLDSFGRALRGLQAGDTPALEYYRGAEKHSVPIELGKFPIPEFPPTGAGLAEQLKGTFAETLAGVRKLVEGISDEEAAHVPAENEWNVKEILAHLILMERDYQTWVAHMLNDTPVQDFLQMSPNVTPRLSTLVKRLGSVEALLTELEASMNETLAMIAALPDSFTHERKHLYRRAAQWATEVTPSHYNEEHGEQFKAVLAAARQP